MNGMTLTRGSGRAIHNPTEADVQEAVGELDEEDGFVILSVEEEEYVQAAGSCLEYRDSTGHYRADGGAVSRATIRAVFVDYLHDRLEWKTRVGRWDDVSASIA